MLISEFDYELPEELIAQQPLVRRDASRMLVLDRRNESWTDSVFSEFPDYLRSNDVVVVNNSRVIPARLSGRRAETGGAVEVFLVRELEPRIWEALVRPGGRLREGARVVFGDQELTGELIDEPGHELRRVRFECDGSFENVLRELGSTPLPPYIKRPGGDSPADRERYQTVYSKSPGAIAAPTAGLHFTDAILERIKARAAVAEVTLHVGYGTFEPVRVEDVDQHSVSSERFTISDEAAESINRARSNGGRVIVVGTTTMRALESAATGAGQIETKSGEASLTIKPGYRFRIADALLTNFHLPRSSLLVLVSAFAGCELVLRAYRHAVDGRYRFYSYGDCMFIV
jgi:S-adenosylmethionine:tRNA ribosyltransferase-isomerase